MRFLILLFSWAFLEGCNYINDECSFNYISLDKSEYKVKGCMRDSVEQGEWFVYDEQNILVEFGRFENGIRVGNWYHKDLNQDSILWTKYENKRLGVVTNIPNIFQEVLDSLYFIKFSINDTSKFLNLVVSINNPLHERVGIDSFYIYSKNDIAEKGWKFESNHTKFSSTGKEYYFNQYTIFPEEAKTIESLNFYGITDNNDFVEVTCTYNSNTNDLARIVFASVVPNLFINSSRFVNPLNIIQ